METTARPSVLELRRKFYKCGGCERVFDRSTHERAAVDPKFTDTWSVCPHCFAQNNVYSPKVAAWTEKALKKVFGLPPEKARQIIAKYSAKKAA